MLSMNSSSRSTITSLADYPLGEICPCNAFLLIQGSNFICNFVPRLIHGTFSHMIKKIFEALFRCVP